MPQQLSASERIERAMMMLRQAEDIWMQEPTGRARSAWCARLRSKILQIRHILHLLANNRVALSRIGATVNQRIEALHILGEANEMWPNARSKRK